MLQFKESIDYEALEIEISDKLDNNDLSWFPISRSFTIEKKQT